RGPVPPARGHAALPAADQRVRRDLARPRPGAGRGCRGAPGPRGAGPRQRADDADSGTPALVSVPRAAAPLPPLRAAPSDPALPPLLHARAAQWHAEHGMPVRALEHALAAEDADVDLI